jgi:hypothetical protein
LFDDDVKEKFNFEVEELYSKLFNESKKKKKKLEV